MATEVEETLKRIQSHRGVKGILIVNSDGVPIRSNLSQVREYAHRDLDISASFMPPTGWLGFPQDLADSYAALITQLATKASSVVRTMDANDDLTFLRIRSKQHEILVAPDKEYSLIVIQNPNLD
jgi:dynein light chain roadblock-type